MEDLEPANEEMGTKMSQSINWLNIIGESVGEKVRSSLEKTSKISPDLPVVQLSLGNRLQEKHIIEGSDVYFECKVLSHPPASEVYWSVDGRELRTNASAGVVADEGFLVIRNISHRLSGIYLCTAINQRGPASSNVINLSVKCEYLAQSKTYNPSGALVPRRSLAVCSPPLVVARPRHSYVRSFVRPSIPSAWLGVPPLLCISSRPLFHGRFADYIYKFITLSNPLLFVVDRCSTLPEPSNEFVGIFINRESYRCAL